MKATFFSGETTVKIAQILFLLKSLMWLLFSVIFVILFLGKAVLIITPIILADAILFLWLGWKIAKKRRWVYYFALLFLFANIVMAFADEFGWADFLVMLSDVAILAFLILKRKQFLPTNIDTKSIDDR